MGWMPRCDFLRGIQIEEIKKNVADFLPATGETGTAYTGRAGSAASGARGYIGGRKKKPTQKCGLFLLHKKEDIMQTIMKKLEDIQPYQKNAKVYSASEEKEYD